MIDPALALVEFDSIAVGALAGDAMAKKASLAQIVTGTVHPGRFLVMIAGEVGPVQESLAAGLAAGASAVVDQIYLPGVHPDVPASIAGARRPMPAEALGIVETGTAAAAIHAADMGLKAADVALLELRLADGLGGKGLVFFGGAVTDVEAAVEAACSVVIGHGHLVNAVIIPQLSTEVAANLADQTRFRRRTGGT